VRFGVIADIQYANLDDGQNYACTEVRHYRGALEMVDAAVAYWAAQQVSFVAQLGDLVDGQCATKTQTSADDLAAVLAKLFKLPVDYLNLIGNHELYNFDRPTLARELGTKRGGGHPAGVEKEFYHTRPCKGWRFLVLDAYQVGSISSWLYLLSQIWPYHSLCFSLSLPLANSQPGCFHCDRRTL
jgi:manganese-dependent ADP-ribose/CDP-alcohol diphosphatase